MRIYSIVIGAVLCAAFGLVAAFAQQPGHEGKEHAGMHHMQGSALAKAAGECALACDTCAAHCTEMLAQGKKEHLDSVKTCLDCASICAATACVAGRNGPFTSVIAEACAEACRLCAEQCEKMGSDPMMKECAEACRSCEKACRAAGKGTGKEHEGH